MNRTQPALNTPLPLAARLQGRVKSGLRVVLSQYVTNGLTVSLPSEAPEAGPGQAASIMQL